MHASNMTTAELVRYGLMYFESLPAPVARESLKSALREALGTR